jgi:hypothetical protein
VIVKIILRHRAPTFMPRASGSQANSDNKAGADRQRICGLSLGARDLYWRRLQPKRQAAHKFIALQRFGNSNAFDRTENDTRLDTLSPG